MLDGSIICVEIAVTRNYCGNNIGESEKPDIQEKEGIGPSGGWFAGGLQVVPTEKNLG